VRPYARVVGILEWIGAHLLAPVVNLYRAFASRPRPELKIHELVPTGGGTNVDFRVVVQNVGTKPMRYAVTARVGETPVQVLDSPVDLLTNAPPTSVQIRVARPTLGDLVKEFNSDTTLYGMELVVEVAEKRSQTKTWREHVYTVEENRVRYEIQPRVWRRGRREETEVDLRAEWLADQFDRG
jgi:hypothetical protein